MNSSICRQGRKKEADCRLPSASCELVRSSGPGSTMMVAPGRCRTTIVASPVDGVQCVIRFSELMRFWLVEKQFNTFDSSDAFACETTKNYRLSQIETPSIRNSIQKRVCKQRTQKKVFLFSIVLSRSPKSKEFDKFSGSS